MRDAPGLRFDAPEIESLWIKFLSDLDLIEHISANDSPDGLTTHVSLTPLPLGQFRCPREIKKMGEILEQGER
jgi:hypothetical protein